MTRTTRGAQVAAVFSGYDGLGLGTPYGRNLLEQVAAFQALDWFQ